ncbi:MAG: hypothetical protein NXI04_28940 [Planctomycetaceae bacterium]|nr:hypothetical protein [Planctomycetaceae bacterium]
MFRFLDKPLPKFINSGVASRQRSVTIRSMYATDTILRFAFPAGRLGSTRIRISFLFVVFALAVSWRLDSVLYGAIATGVLLFSVLAHELTHLLIARSTGGDMDEMRLWPLGGLSEPHGRGFLQDHVHTMMGGPVVNLLLALTCIITLNVDHVMGLLNPFAPFDVPVDEAMSVTAWRMAFQINWVLFLVNMLPITPFDNGVLMRTYLTTRFTEAESRDLIIRLGLVMSIFGMLTGFVFGLSSLVMVSAIVLVFQIHDNVRWHEIQGEHVALSQYDMLPSESLEEEWLDEEESEYTLTDDDSLDRWRDDREQEQLRLEQEERRREEAQVDDILTKIHQDGRDSLTTSELRLLNRMSDRLRNRRQHS